MPQLRYDTRMPRFHRVMLMMAKNADLYERLPEGDSRYPRFDLGIDKACPRCKSMSYVVCSAPSCGFSLCFDCEFSEHLERAFAKHS